MNKYLLIENFEASEPFFFIVEALTPSEAHYYAAEKFYKTDELFIDYLKECCVNSGFSEKFWIQTPKESEYFYKHGKVLIGFDEFKKRVKNYFERNNQNAEDYLTYYMMEIDEKKIEAEIAFENFINNNKKILIQEYINYTDYKILNMSEIKKL
jgi:hypothetical protein